MLNKITVAKFWMVSSFFAAASVFAKDCNNTPAPATKSCPKKTCEQKCEQPCELPAAPTLAAYSAPARINVCGSWDFYATGTFLYWQAQQENMELGIAVNDGTADLVPFDITGTTPNPGSVINMDFDFKPGFKLGLGMNFEYDNWDGYAEYTWFHETNTQSSNGPATNSAIWLMGYHPRLLGTTTPVATSASENWRLKMDFVDLLLARAHYVGTKLSFRPFVGARGAWIRQRVNYAASLQNATVATALGVANNQSLASNQNSRSWGIGPEIGLDTNWMFGYGLRMTAKAEADLLYTRYTTTTGETVTNLNTGAIITRDEISQKHSDYLRPHANLEMGFGWGTYFDNNKWHFDLLATYGFQVFWNQNMFRHFTDDIVRASSNAPNGDLFVQGLNLTARFDF